MGKVKVLIGLIVAVLLCLPALGAPVSNPASLNVLRLKPEEGAMYPIKLGFEYESVDKRDLNIRDDNAELALDLYTLKIAYSLRTQDEKGDFYVLIGSLRQEVKNLFAEDVNFVTEKDLLLGLGITIPFYENQSGMRIGFDAKFRFAEPPMERIEIQDERVAAEGEVKYREWQLGLGISQQFKRFIPYAGLKYSDIRSECETTAAGDLYEWGKTKSEETVGLFAGCDILLLDRVSLNVEGRFRDEEAVSATLVVGF